VALSVEALRTIGFRGGGAAARDDRQGGFVLDLLADFRTVVGFVGGDRERRFRRLEEVADDLTVVDLTACYDEVQRAAFAVDDRVNLRGATAAADADPLFLLPPFAPPAAR
jgi:hypothetical protein